MQENIRVGMAQCSDRVGYQHATEPKLPAFHQLVHVKAEADAQHHSTGFFFPPFPSKRKPSVNRRVLANGLRCALAIK